MQYLCIFSEIWVGGDISPFQIQATGEDASFCRIAPHALISSGFATPSTATPRKAAKMQYIWYFSGIWVGGDLPPFQIRANG